MALPALVEEFQVKIYRSSGLYYRLSGYLKKRLDFWKKNLYFI
jgi:hypothetical protein